MRLLILGLGAIGQRHLRAARRVKNDIEILALRSGEGSGLLISDTMQAISVKSLAETLNIKETYEQQVAKEFHATHILDSRIPSEHLSGLDKIISNETKILVEKPISSYSSSEVRQRVKTLHTKDCSIFVAYHLLQHPLIQRLRKDLCNSEVHRYEIEHCEHIEHFQNFRPGESMHEIDMQKSGGIMYSFSHSINLGIYLFGLTKNLYRDEFSSYLGTCRHGDVPVHELISVVHKSSRGSIYGVIRLAFDSHIPNFRIIVHLHHKSIVVDVAKGTYEVWHGHKLLEGNKCSISKPDLLTLQMSSFLEMPYPGLAESSQALCTYDEGLECIKAIESVRSRQG